MIPTNDDIYFGLPKLDEKIEKLTDEMYQGEMARREIIGLKALLAYLLDNKLEGSFFVSKDKIQEYVTRNESIKFVYIPETQNIVVEKA